MSLGIFRTIRGSFAEPYRKEADQIIRALNEEFARRRIPQYEDPDPDEGGLRMLPCGNAGASTWGALHQQAQGAGLTWTLGSLRGERQIALPIPFTGKFRLTYGHTLLVLPLIQEFCAIRTVADELAAIAPVLGIPLVDGSVTDEIADRLANCEPLPGDPEDATSGPDDARRQLAERLRQNQPPIVLRNDLENVRGLWLDLHLACRYSLEDKTPVVIG